MQILFMGTPDFARVILESIIVKFDIIGLFCQPDKPFGRKKELKIPSTKEFIVNYYPQIPIFQPIDFDDKILQIISNLKFDLIVVVAYGKILPRSVLQYRCINVHASILPKYRGASPIQEMILHNDKFFGVSVMQMEESLDSGDILAISLMKNDGNIKLEKLSLKLANIGARLIQKVLEKEIVPLKQDNILASYCKKIKKEAGCITFENAKNLYNASRAYQGWPGIFLSNGLKLFDIELESSNGRYKSGEILEITREKICIGCGEGRVWIGALQAPNKQKLCAFNYVHGKRLQVGMILE